MNNILAVQGVVGIYAVDGFADTQAIGIVSKSIRGAGLGHLLQLTALFPGVCPCAVGEGIVDGVNAMYSKIRYLYR